MIAAPHPPPHARETPPGRRQRRAAETRERLLRAALALFAERGYADVTVADITEAADVGKGTFFNYFPSKEHVLMAFGELQVGKLAAALARVRAGAGAAETLRGLPFVMAEEPGRSPKLISSVFAAHYSNDVVREMFARKQAQGRAILKEIVRLGQKRSEIRSDADPAELALGFQQSFFGTLVMWAMDPGVPLRKRLRATLRLATLGLTPRRSSRR